MVSFQRKGNPEPLCLQKEIKGGERGKGLELEFSTSKGSVIIFRIPIISPRGSWLGSLYFES